MSIKNNHICYLFCTQVRFSQNSCLYRCGFALQEGSKGDFDVIILLILNRHNEVWPTYNIFQKLHFVHTF